MITAKHQDFDCLFDVMQELGCSLMVWRGDPYAKKLHSKSAFKTEADRRAHAFFCVNLNKLFPGVPIISEEDAVHSNVRPAKYWLIDPIDGTASWHGGFDGFVTQAAYIENGVPIFGVIHCPPTGKTWTALKGAGARVNGIDLPKLKAADRLIITDNTPEPHGIAAQLMDHLSATGYYESGSLGLKAALVADGTADLFVKRVVVRDWDIAPVAVLLEEVGGYLSLPSGKPFNFDGSMIKPEGVIVARDPELLARAVEAIARIESVNKK